MSCQHHCSHSKKPECNSYDGDKMLERKQRESEEELENAKRTLRNTENVVRQSFSGMSPCHVNQGTVKKATNPYLNHPSHPCKSGAMSGKEAIKKLARLPTSAEMRAQEKSPCQDLNATYTIEAAQSPCKTFSIPSPQKETKSLPKKPLLTREELNKLIEQETQDIETTMTITADSHTVYKKPCPKQQKARDAVKALVEPKKEEIMPCLLPSFIKEPLPFLDPDPEDISPEVAASMMYIQERGIKMISCPEDTIKQLFSEQFGSADEEETEKKKVSGEPEPAEGQAEPAEVADDKVDDSVFTRNMNQQRENGEDDRTSTVVQGTGNKTYDKKGEFVLQEKAAKCVNKVQLRGNFPTWFPGYYAAFPDSVGESAVQLEKSPSDVFQKAWMATKRSNFPAADLYLVE